MPKFIIHVHSMVDVTSNSSKNATLADCAKENEQRQTMVLRLDKSGDEFTVGEIEI